MSTQWDHTHFDVRYSIPLISALFPPLQYESPWLKSPLDEKTTKTIVQDFVLFCRVRSHTCDLCPFANTNQLHRGSIPVTKGREGCREHFVLYLLAAHRGTKGTVFLCMSWKKVTVIDFYYRLCCFNTSNPPRGINKVSVLLPGEMRLFQHSSARDLKPVLKLTTCDKERVLNRNPSYTSKHMLTWHADPHVFLMSGGKARCRLFAFLLVHDSGAGFSSPIRHTSRPVTWSLNCSLVLTSTLGEQSRSRPLTSREERRRRQGTPLQDLPLLHSSGPHSLHHAFLNNDSLIIIITLADVQLITANDLCQQSPWVGGLRGVGGGV